MQQLNVTTLVNLLAAVTPGMIAARSGRIVTVGAHAALRGVAGLGAYSASKAAAMRITDSAAAELQPLGLNVTVMLPQTLHTPEQREPKPDTAPDTRVR